jgi:hypothetical protein
VCRLFDSVFCFEKKKKITYKPKIYKKKKKKTQKSDMIQKVKCSRSLSLVELHNFYLYYFTVVDE